MADSAHRPPAEVEAVVKALWDSEFDYSPEEARERAQREHESDGWVDDFLDAMKNTARVAIATLDSVRSEQPGTGETTPGEIRYALRLALDDVPGWEAKAVAALSSPPDGPRPAEPEAEIDWERCPCGCDIPMSHPDYPALHGDTPDHG